MSAPTVASILTGLGQSGIAIVALAGPASRELAAAVFRPHRVTDVPRAADGTLLYGRVFDGETEIDEALLAVRHPRGGPWIAEINCHGGIIPVRKVAQLLQKHGAELIPWRRFLVETHAGDRITAEAKLQLAEARTERAVRVFARQADGALSEEIARLARELSEQKFADAAKRIEKLLATEPLGRVLIRPAKVVIAGAPNVGKSSLLNALVGSPRAIVHPVPGTTRDVVSAQWSVRGLPVVFADTAGLRNAGDEVEVAGVRLAHLAASEAELVLFVADLSRPIADSRPEALETTGAARKILVANKSDLRRRFEASDFLRDKRTPVVVTSARTGEGIEALAAEIERALLGEAADARTDDAVLFIEPLADELREALAGIRRGEFNRHAIRSLRRWID